MRLEEIGFYTLEDNRAKSCSSTSPLWRCELILTDLCNFKCPYCRGIEYQFRGSLTYDEATHIVDMWADEGLKNIRFSGGEPTVWKGLVDLCKYAKSRGIEKVAISTNGSAKQSLYTELLPYVDDFSISLDACCAETGDNMAGGKKGAWRRVVENIRYLSQHVYVTVGVVLTTENIQEFYDIVTFADSLGVSDIRVVTSAQWNEPLSINIPEGFLNRHPILKYRVGNFNQGRNIRGIQKSDSHQCPLVLDDMAVLKGKHYPCIIYMREQGIAIGDMKDSFRLDRSKWFETHDTHQDSICKKNCLDVCIDYNNKVKSLQGFRV